MLSGAQRFDGPWRRRILFELGFIGFIGFIVFFGFFGFLGFRVQGLGIIGFRV